MADLHVMTESPASQPDGDNSKDKVKLRSSCDRCRSKKIRCSQEKPACRRCLSRGLPCDYSRSVRSGRPSKSRQRANLESQQNPQECFSVNVMPSSTVDKATPAVSHSHTAPDFTPSMQSVSSFSESMDFEDILASTSSSLPNPSPYGLFYRDQTLGADKYFLPTALDYDLGDECVVKQERDGILRTDGFFSTTQTISSLEEVENHPYYLSSPSDFDLTTPSLDSEPSPLSSDAFDKPSTPKLASDLPHDCMATTINTLSSLYLLSNTHLPAYQVEALGSTPTIDQVLQVNKEALKKCSSVLTCTCSKDGSFAVLMCTVFSRILTWYQAIVEIIDPTLEDSYQFASMINDSVVHRPFSVGAYKLDKELERVMKHQLVLNELREMTKWVRTCVDGYCSLPSTPMTGLADFNDDSAQGQRINSQLGALLEIRLQRTIEELEQRLLQSSNEPCQLL